MTLEEVIAWKRELAISLRAVVARFNEGVEQPDHRIDPVDEIRNVLGIRIVKTQYPSCYLELEFEPSRHPAIKILCVRIRQRDVERRTEDKYPIVSRVGEPLRVDDGVAQTLDADDLAELIIGLFTVPANE